MKLNDKSDPIGEKVDARSDELMIEFEKHCAELVETHPEHEGKRDLIFQGWLIQKVASLQLCVGELERRIAELQEK